MIEWYYRTKYFIKDIPRNIRNGFQRAFRGYGDDDAWNLDWYVAKIIIGGLKKISKDGYSVSINYFDNLDNAHDNYSDGKKKRDDEYKKAIEALENWLKDDYSDHGESHKEAVKAMQWYAKTFGEHWD